ncbi:MAG: hypothetical protein ABI140_18615 [Jatrophihabitantaceae bacterium]
MDAFSDLFDANQPADLERALQAMLARREADITEADSLNLDAEAPAAPSSHRFGDTAPGGLLVSLLAAAAVVLVVAGSLFAAHGLRHAARPATNLPNQTHQPTPAPDSTVPSPTSSPTRTATICSMPASWRSAIAAGKVAVDQPQNQPVSGASDGSFLMKQTASSGGQETHQELAIFDRAGHGSTIWQAADPVHDYVDVSPDSAVSAGWVVFGLTRSQNLADHGVAAWNRATGQLSTVRLLSTAEDLSANMVIDVAPIVAGNTAYWIEHKFGDGAHQTLVAQPLPSGNRSTRQVSTVDRLVAVGGGVALLHNPTDSIPGHTGGLTQTLTAGPGLALPAALHEVAGVWFSSDGNTLRWTNGPAATALLSWRPGQQTVQSQAVHRAELRAQPIGPFLIGQSTMVDTRNGAVYRSATGPGFAVAAGGDLIGAVFRVAISALVPTPC